jgi:hypothetical protein
VIGDPPSLAGGVHETTACVSPASAVTLAGALGGLAGTTNAKFEFGPVPTEFVACTQQTYWTGMSSALTVIGEVAPVPVFVGCAFGSLDEHVAVYPVIGSPPLLAGTVKATEALFTPAVAVAAVGAPGNVAGVTLLAVDSRPDPTPLVACTVHAYCVPLSRLPTVTGELVPVPVRVV